MHPERASCWGGEHRAWRQAAQDLFVSRGCTSPSGKLEFIPGARHLPGAWVSRKVSSQRLRSDSKEEDRLVAEEGTAGGTWCVWERDQALAGRRYWGLRQMTTEWARRHLQGATGVCEELGEKRNTARGLEPPFLGVSCSSVLRFSYYHISTHYLPSLHWTQLFTSFRDQETKRC